MDDVPIAPLDTDAAVTMWREYASARPTIATDREDPPVERFGDSAEMADELLDLVLAGSKRATAALVADFAAEGEPLPRLGAHWVACDGAGTPRVVLRSTDLRVGAIETVDDAFAWDEGEGDRSRDDWLRMHRGFWRRTLHARGDEWHEDLEVVFERFAVVWPPSAAD